MPSKQNKMFKNLIDKMRVVNLIIFLFNQKEKYYYCYF